MAKGYLIINTYNSTIANPVRNANVIVLKDNKEIYNTYTDDDGKTNTITLDTVDKKYSYENQNMVRPYETYNILVKSLGLADTRVNGVQIFDDVTSIQDIYLPSIDDVEEDTQEVSPNTLWGIYPEYINNTYTNNSDIEPIILKKVLVPKNIIVHDGIPSNSSAKNYTVPFTDYIKNVASSEIYSTWPKEAIKANVLAIISFTLNRIYTEWYRNKGYNFTITSTTNYDQKYTRNGTIFESISKIVDEIFTNYIRNGIRVEPLLAQYRNETSEKGYLSQWGSKELADKGYNATKILKYYYGNDINISTAEVTDDYPYSFEKTLKIGDCNIDVYILQNSLNFIHGSYPGIPIIKNPSGYFDSNTQSSVKTFQKVFSLSQTGEVDYQTWYKLSYILTATQDLTINTFN